jgi:hypothetical protein
VAARRSSGSKSNRAARESRALAAKKAARTRKAEARDLARLLRQDIAIEKRERAIRERAAAIGKALGRGRPVSLVIARHVQREFRKFSKNPAALTWIGAFMEREAKRTGRLPTEAQVRRNPEFRAALSVVFATNKRSSRGVSGPLARALVTLGVRDPDLKFDVGSYVMEGGRYVRRVQRK